MVNEHDDDQKIETLDNIKNKSIDTLSSATIPIIDYNYSLLGVPEPVIFLNSQENAELDLHSTGTSIKEPDYDQRQRLSPKVITKQ